MTSDTKQSMTAKKGGAPIGNGNHIRHGLTRGRLPKGAAYIARITAEFRSSLEGAVAERNKGDISLHHAGCIQTAIRWERHALFAQRWLRHEAETLTPDQRLAFSRDVARASAERDKCLKALGLDVTPSSDPWSALDAPATPSDVHNAGGRHDSDGDDSDTINATGALDGDSVDETTDESHSGNTTTKRERDER